ncbi:MAG TPA: sugar ABC transporter permease [Clostridiaceae bacterium]|nr:sugar ABC transporter permease [Clostridiaceae bacterium]
MFKMRYYYLLLLPVLVYFILFHYIPMYGITLAFKDYSFSLGILKSPWAGFKYFDRLFSSPTFHEVVRNTVIISFYKIVISFPVPIIFALLLNEIYHKKIKRAVQTISYLPHFISWVILSGIIMEVLSPARGVVNYIITLFGGDPIHFLAEPKYFRSVLVITHIWQTMGWNSIVYLAAISSISTEQFDSAYIDGANRFQIIRYITIPSIASVITVLFILGLGNILNAGFDQIINLYNPVVYNVADILDTYVYRVGLVNFEYSYSTAANLFKNAIGFAFVLTANFIARHIGEGENALW